MTTDLLGRQGLAALDGAIEVRLGVAGVESALDEKGRALGTAEERRVHDIAVGLVVRRIKHGRGGEGKRLQGL